MDIIHALHKNSTGFVIVEAFIFENKEKQNDLPKNQQNARL